MKKGEFISVSKRMVKEYHNRYVANETIPKILKKDVNTVGFYDEGESYRILLSTQMSDAIYEVMYDVKHDQVCSCIYKERSRGRADMIERKLEVIYEKN